LSYTYISYDILLQGSQGLIQKELLNEVKCIGVGLSL